MSSYYDLLQEGEKRLREAGVPEPKADAWYLFSRAFSMNRAEYFLKNREEAPADRETWKRFLERRCRREPVQYILGDTEFYGLPFAVGPGVLVPRQDTEPLIERILREEDLEAKAVLDVCTGSGCIGLALAVHRPDWQVTLTDLSEEALAIAGRNRDALSPQTEIFQGDLFAGIPAGRKYDILVSNPPYIPSSVISELEKEVKEYEPYMALDGKEDGLFFYERIAKEGKAYLKPGSRIYLEIGYDQGESVPELLRKAGYGEVIVEKDLAGLDRIVRGVLTDV